MVCFSNIIPSVSNNLIQNRFVTLQCFLSTKLCIIPVKA